MNAITEERKVLLEIADLKVHFDIKDGKQWFWQPSKTLKAVDGVTLRLYEGETLGVVGESGVLNVTRRSLTSRRMPECCCANEVSCLLITALLNDLSGRGHHAGHRR